MKMSCISKSSKRRGPEIAVRGGKRSRSGRSLAGEIKIGKPPKIQLDELREILMKECNSLG